MSTITYKLTPLIQATFFFFKTHTTAVDSFKHSQQTGLLPSAIGCALFVTFQIILKSMSLRFRSQTYFGSLVSFLYTLHLKIFMISVSESELSISWCRTSSQESSPNGNGPLSNYVCILQRNYINSVLDFISVKGTISISYLTLKLF